MKIIIYIFILLPYQHRNDISSKNLLETGDKNSCGVNKLSIIKKKFKVFHFQARSFNSTSTVRPLGLSSPPTSQKKFCTALTSPKLIWFRPSDESSTLLPRESSHNSVQSIEYPSALTFKATGCVLRRTLQVRLKLTSLSEFGVKYRSTGILLNMQKEKNLI